MKNTLSKAVAFAKNFSKRLWSCTYGISIRKKYLDCSITASGVASMEQMEQLLSPGRSGPTCVIRANPVRYSGGEGGGINKGGICNATKMCSPSAILTLI